ncbi:hypothetical protein [Flavilitoribacter nigricans]|uniref:Uncharacterized protein n=1 Tax=Flavilitoribacter nigricans (strain ATCC 23147 / DSM 23189 / NBRC 102662 / NCIMB 1420 / SS-2) TaxID=1122177 RepID=A0A2D0MXR3_FLAN2|nr:hypothetical protein [Flavilitoribacter nigricans]PHN00916.1 hypothetical protein CRP01_39670 [Flavilitoribacter nigricans DSM 23189 = NBRC 102662]
MSKREKRSITDLINQATPDEHQVEAAVHQIHQNIAQPKKEKTTRATVDIPVSFHKELKKLLIDESMELKTFCLQAIQEKYERLTSATDKRPN